jgi:hypothetical protein
VFILSLVLSKSENLGEQEFANGFLPLPKKAPTPILDGEETILGSGGEDPVRTASRAFRNEASNSHSQRTALRAQKMPIGASAGDN